MIQKIPDAPSESDPRVEPSRPDGSRAAPAPGPEAPDESLVSALARAGVQGLEIADHVTTLFRVRADRARLAVRRAAVRGAVLALALAALAAVLLVAAARLVAGVAGGLAAACDGRAWLGDLLGGALCLALVAGLVAVGVRIDKRTQLRARQAEYAERHRRHAERFGPPKPAASAD